MWLLYAFSGPILWAVSTHIDKFLVDKYFRHSDTAVLMVFTALLGVIALPVIWLFEPKVLGLSLDKNMRLSSFKPRLVLLMLAATFVVALSSVVFKFFAVHDEFWSTTFWTFVGEGLFGAAILALPKFRKQFVTLFRRNPGAV